MNVEVCGICSRMLDCWTEKPLHVASRTVRLSESVESGVSGSVSTYLVCRSCSSPLLKAATKTKLREQASTLYMERAGVYYKDSQAWSLEKSFLPWDVVCAAYEYDTRTTLASTDLVFIYPLKRVTHYLQAPLTSWQGHSMSPCKRSPLLDC